jgi:hypothetical protein
MYSAVDYAAVTDLCCLHSAYDLCVLGTIATSAVSSEKKAQVSRTCRADRAQCCGDDGLLYA